MVVVELLDEGEVVVDELFREEAVDGLPADAPAQFAEIHHSLVCEEFCDFGVSSLVHVLVVALAQAADRLHVLQRRDPGFELRQARGDLRDRLR